MRKTRSSIRSIPLGPAAVIALLAACGGGGSMAAGGATGGSGASAASSSSGGASTTSSSSSGGASTTSSSSGGASTTSSSTTSSSTTSSTTSSNGGGDGGTACTSTCDPSIGLCMPLAVCSSSDPCTVSGKTIVNEIDVPTCKTDPTTGHPVFDDGAPATWNDSDGDARYACVHTPAGASSAAPLPLLVFLHGSHGGADDLYSYTLLRQKADTAQLSADASRTGFVVASMQGRNLHWLGPNPAGSHHDYFHRDLASPSDNPDIRSLDHLIDTLVAGGSVDPAQIYVAGWSNGAYFSMMYAIARHDTATPGGNHVAAAVAYAGADPFNTPAASLPCQLGTYPRSQAPIFLVHRSCDAIVPCDEAHLGSLPAGSSVEGWKQTLTGASGVGDANVQDLVVDDAGATVAGCASTCGLVVGTENHLRWPDGIADKGDVDHEPEMIAFLRAHPLP